MLIYCVTIVAFFAHAKPSVQSEQTIMLIASIFITLLGMMLMLISLPLSKQASETYSNLMFRCDFSEQTHRMYEYAHVLHNIRAQPDCMTKFSVEECVGYEEAPPYTSFFKAMESDFRCAGFCWKAAQPAQATAALQVGATSEAATALHQQHRDLHRRHQQNGGKLSLLSTKAQTKSSMQSAQYPPTLFSDANYQSSCDGMAARDMKNFAGDIGVQTFYQGVYLICIAIATGFLKLIGFCVRKDREVPEVPPPFKHG